MVPLNLLCLNLELPRKASKTLVLVCPPPPAKDYNVTGLDCVDFKRSPSDSNVNRHLGTSGLRMGLCLLGVLPSGRATWTQDPTTHFLCVTTAKLCSLSNLTVLTLKCTQLHRTVISDGGYEGVMTQSI